MNNFFNGIAAISGLIGLILYIYVERDKIFFQKDISNDVRKCKYTKLYYLVNKIAYNTSYHICNRMLGFNWRYMANLVDLKQKQFILSKGC